MSQRLPNEANERYRAPALDRGLDILEVLADEAGGLTRAEIVGRLGVSASQIYRMLERLVARGYVSRIAGGDRYALSMKLFLLGSNHPPIRRLVSAAQPLMDGFSTQYQQSLHIVVPERGRGVVVAQSSPISHWEFRARVGAELDLFSTGSGLTLLAMQDGARFEQAISKWGLAPDDPRLQDVSDALETIRRQGYRAARSAQMIGIKDLSVPICGPDGDAVAVVTCACIESPDREDRADWQTALEGLKTLAGALTMSLA